MNCGAERGVGREELRPASRRGSRPPPCGQPDRRSSSPLCSQVASRQAARLAARSEVQSAFVRRDATTLGAIANARPDVGFILWNGRTIGQSAIDLPHAAITVYGRGRLGQVVVAARPDVPLLEAARKGAPATGAFYTVGGRVAAASPALNGRTPAEVGDPAALALAGPAGADRGRRDLQGAGEARGAPPYGAPADDGP